MTKTVTPKHRRVEPKFPIFPWRIFDAPGWMAKGLCVTEAYPDLWFPDTPGRTTDEVKQAVRICDRCPVRAECLAYAERHGEGGIWGGLTEQQRAERAGRRRPKRVY